MKTRLELFAATFILLFTSTWIQAQHLGINNDSPQQALDVKGGFVVSGDNFIIGQQSNAALLKYNMGQDFSSVDSSGLIYDHGGPANQYGPNRLDSFNLYIGNGAFIQLDVISMDTEYPYDSLSIINANNNAHIATLSGNDTGSYRIPGNVKLYFNSNAFNQLDGYQIRWDIIYPNPQLDPDQNLGPGGRLQYMSDKNALRSGMVDSDQWDVENAGDNSFAVGKNTEATGNQSMAQGLGTIASATNSFATGIYNLPIGSALFQVGNGSSEDFRSNAMSVYGDGDLQIGGTYYGDGSGLTNLTWKKTGGDAYYNDGDVGIGTSSIDAKVEVYQNSSLSDPHILLHENGNDYARLNFKNNNGSNYWSIAAYIASNYRNDRLNFWNGVGGDVMTITGDGEVGIGVGISPKTTFHVGNGRRVLFGIDTLGNGDKLMFLPDLHAFRVGTLATGAASTYWNRDSIGLYSFASGYNTRAQGFGATAMGRDTEATNSYAMATGFFSNADGLYSTAMGFNTDAFATGSTALGYSTDAEESYSFAAGYTSEAQGLASVALGNFVRAQSHSSMAVGRYNLGGGDPTVWNATDPIFEVGIGTNSSSRSNAMTVLKNGNIGIGIHTPQSQLHITGQFQFGSVEYIVDGGSSQVEIRGSVRPDSDNLYDLGSSTFRYDDVYASSGVVNTSDFRDKKEIEEIPYGLGTVMQLNPVRYEWKNDKLTGRKKLGLIAQEVESIVSEVVKTTDPKLQEDGETVVVEELDRLGIYYSDLIPVLIKGMQDQQAIIEALEARIKTLEDQ